MSADGLHDRLIAAAEGKTYRALSELTGHHPETIRRYMQGQAPAVEFVALFCAKLRINAHWLLTGEGAMRQDDQRKDALERANPAELLSAVASALERLTDRVDRLERFVQTLDVRSRARDRAAGDSEVQSRKASASDGRTPRSADQPADRAARVADAVAERPRADDR